MKLLAIAACVALTACSCPCHREALQHAGELPVRASSEADHITALRNAAPIWAVPLPQ